MASLAIETTAFEKRKERLVFFRKTAEHGMESGSNGAFQVHWEMSLRSRDMLGVEHVASSVGIAFTSHTSTTSVVRRRIEVHGLPAAGNLLLQELELYWRACMLGDVGGRSHIPGPHTCGLVIQHHVSYFLELAAYVGHCIIYHEWHLLKDDGDHLVQCASTTGCVL